MNEPGSQQRPLKRPQQPTPEQRAWDKQRRAIGDALRHIEFLQAIGRRGEAAYREQTEQGQLVRDAAKYRLINLYHDLSVRIDSEVVSTTHLNSLRKIRNIAAHDYGEFNEEFLWGLLESRGLDPIETKLRALLDEDIKGDVAAGATEEIAAEPTDDAIAPETHTGA